MVSQIRNMETPIGKLEVEMEVKCPPEKFWQGLRANVFPKALPQDDESIEVLEGDGKSVGSVRLVCFADGSSLISSIKKKIDAVDEENKMVTYSVIGGDLLKYYKNFKAHLAVTPKGDGSLVKWASEFEKAHEEIPNPNLIRDFAVKGFQDLDEYLKEFEKAHEKIPDPNLIRDFAVKNFQDLDEYLKA